MPPRAKPVFCLFGPYAPARASDLSLGGPEGGLLHPQWVEEPLLQELLIRHPADDLDDTGRDIRALVSVGILLAGLPLERAGDRTQRAGLQRSAVRPRDLLEFGRAGQAAGVAEHVPDRDGTHRGLQQDVRSVFFLDDHPLAQLRDVLADGIVQADLALVHEHHRGRPREHLRHRRDPEDVVLGDRLLRLDVRVAEQVSVMDLPILVGDDADGPRELVGVQVRLKRVAVTSGLAGGSPSAAKFGRGYDDKHQHQC